MKYKNSFFKIDIREDGTYLKIYPPMNGGKKLDLDEVTSFLQQKDCVDYKIQDIRNIIDSNTSEIEEVKVSNEPIAEFDEIAKVTVASNRLVAYIRFYPPSTNGKLMTKADIVDELEKNKVKYGVQARVIDVFLMARQYCLDIPIAKGVPMTLAKDTEIVYCFDTKPLAKPKVLEDGSVDFHELNLFTKVNKGDKLAYLVPHKDGINGTDVFGNAILTNKPKVKVLKFGRNIQLSEDKSEITSLVDGDVMLTDSTVFVSDTYVVAADVDASTGDIEYEGNVQVNGTVRTGFTIKCNGNVQVNGVVEGATIIAEGNIVIKRGVQGMNKGLLKAKGDICAQFFESAKVIAGGDIIAGSVLHSEITSGGKLEVKGKKGFIVGGEICVENYVEVSNIGNKMETPTTIKVGVKPELLEEIKPLVGEVNELNAQIEEENSYLNVYKQKLAKGIALSDENKKNIRERKAKIEELDKEKRAKSARLQELKALIDQGKNSKVKVLGNSYRGVTIYMASYVYSVKDKDIRPLYVIEGSEIKITSF